MIKTILEHLGETSRLPLIGAIPAVFLVGIGVLHSITNLALAIISYIPSFFSKNLKHLFEKFLSNIVFGIQIAIGGTILIIKSIFFWVIDLIVALEKRRQNSSYNNGQART